MNQLPEDLPPVPPEVAPMGLKLEFAFQIRMLFRERMRLAPTTPMGGRVYVPPVAGVISGPRLRGVVMPYSGADYARGRADGVAELNAHYMLQADDGALIYINNRGYLYGRDEQGKPLVLSEEQRKTQNFKIKSNTYFFITPVFDAPVGPHEWLTRTIIVGRGRRLPEPDHTVFDYYAVV